MKKIQFIIIGVLALVSSACVKEEIESALPTGKETLVRIATFEMPETGTRTVLNNDMSVSWQKGDEISVHNASAAAKLANVLEDGHDAIFEGMINLDVFNSANTNEIYIYPASTSSRLTYWGHHVSGVKVHAEQPLVANTFARGYNVSAALHEITGNEPIYFKNLCGLLNLKLKGDAAVKSIKIEGPESAKLNGTFEVVANGNHAENNPGKLASFAVQGLSNATNTILLSTTEPVALTAEGVDFYACVLPYGGFGDYSISVVTDDEGLYTKTITVNESVTAAQITTIGEFNLEDLDLYIGDVFKSSSYSFDASANSLDIMGTRYLPKEYTVESPEDWITTAVISGGVSVAVKENTTGAVRDGQVLLKSNGEVMATLAIRQTVFNYESLLGTYEISFKQGASLSGLAGGTIMTQPMVLSVKEEGVSYNVLFTSGNRNQYKYTMVLDYTAVGAGSMSLTCPQNSEVTNDYWGMVTSKVHLAKVSSTIFSNIQTDIDIDKEGTGFDLVLTGDGSTVIFDFIPNIQTRDFYPDTDLCLHFPGMRADNVQVDLDLLYPLEGEKYLRMVKK